MQDILAARKQSRFISYDWEVFPTSMNNVTRMQHNYHVPSCLLNLYKNEVKKKLSFQLSLGTVHLLESCKAEVSRVYTKLNQLLPVCSFMFTIQAQSGIKKQTHDLALKCKTALIIYFSNDFHEFRIYAC